MNYTKIYENFRIASKALLEIFESVEEHEKKHECDAEDITTITCDCCENEKHEKVVNLKNRFHSLKMGAPLFLSKLYEEFGTLYITTTSSYLSGKLHVTTNTVRKHLIDLSCLGYLRVNEKKVDDGSKHLYQSNIQITDLGKRFVEKYYPHLMKETFVND